MRGSRMTSVNSAIVEGTPQNALAPSNESGQGPQAAGISRSEVQTFQTAAENFGECYEA